MARCLRSLPYALQQDMVVLRVVTFRVGYALLRTRIHEFTLMRVLIDAICMLTRFGTLLGEGLFDFIICLLC